VAPDAQSCPHCRGHLATRRCLRCFVLNPGQAERCSRCGTLLPKEELAAPPPGRCPDCRLDLVARAFGAVGYAECPRCGGLQLGQAAFDAATRDADTRATVRLEKPAVIHEKGSPLPPVKYRRCPSCGELMNRLNYAGGSGVIVDRCRDHGVWFDRGELTAIVDFLESGGWDRVRERERRRLKEEVASLESRKRFDESISLPPAAGSRGLHGFETVADVLGFLGGLFKGS
jgi:Zn-finger nucleic acid-binding protein/ribosomal protein L40E